MSSSLLFGAGAIVTFITLWGVLMAGGMFATRHEPADAPIVSPASRPVSSVPTLGSDG